MKPFILRAAALCLLLCLCLPLATACRSSTESAYVLTFTRTYDAANTLLELRTNTYNQNGWLESSVSDTLRRDLTYDRKGNLLTERTAYLRDGAETEVYEDRWEYDRKGNAVRHSRYRLEGETETLLGVTDRTYDREGRILTETGVQTATAYVYGENGGYTATETLVKDGSAVRVTTVEMNAAGQITSRKLQSADGSLEEYTATYSESGDLLTERYAFNGAEMESFRYEYEAHGEHSHLARCIALREDAEIERTVYGYDKNHNRTTAAVCTPEGVVKRTYVYEYTLMDIKKTKK